MLSNSKVTDEGLLQLSQLVRLKILYLDRTTVSDAGIVVVKGRQALLGYPVVHGLVVLFPPSTTPTPPPPPPILVDLCVETWVATFGGATLPPPPPATPFFLFLSCGSLWKLGWQPLVVLSHPPFLFCFCFYFDVDLCGNWDGNCCSVLQVLEQIADCVQAMVTVCCVVTLCFT